MLFFFFLSTWSNLRQLLVFGICYTLVIVSNASLKLTNQYPRHHLSLSSSIDSPSMAFDERFERTQRATGYFVYRKGEYLFFYPDRKHHFSKTIRPYIGRRR